LKCPTKRAHDDEFDLRGEGKLVSQVFGQLFTLRPISKICERRVGKVVVLYEGLVAFSDVGLKSTY
jgi:hypothetical protein